jgi:hypothetical protein
MGAARRELLYQEMRVREIVTAATLLLAAATAGAQEVGVLAGAMDVINSSKGSYSWALEYRQYLTWHFDWSFAWLNEGHPRGHHRDGFTPQLWLGDTLFEDRFVVGVGAGPYRYFDTVRGADGRAVDLNEWGAAVSLSAGWRPSSRTTLRFTVVRTYTSRDVETHLYLVGVDWRLHTSKAPVVAVSERPLEVARRTVETEVMAFAGRSILNDFHSPSSNAWGLEYRHGIGSHTDWTLSWLNEGRSISTDRDGLIGEIWAENGYSHEHLVLGVGAGPYLYDDRRKPDSEGGSHRGVAAVVSLSASWRFAGRWFTRLTWNRVASFYDRDADVIVLGLGATTGRGWE